MESNKKFLYISSAIMPFSVNGHVYNKNVGIQLLSIYPLRQGYGAFLQILWLYMTEKTSILKTAGFLHEDPTCKSKDPLTRDSTFFS